MLKSIYSFLLICILFFTTQAQQNESFLLRSPALSADGSQASFSYQGDIWKVSADGGMAQRLTVHESYEGAPKWSPDGNSIAFVSNRHGNNDIFTLSLTGAAPKRLTYHSTSDRSVQWAGDGNLIFCTRRAFGQVEREQEFHMISKDGGTPYRMMDAMGDMPAVSPNGRFVAFTRGSCRVAREAYTGPANRSIWLYDTKSKTYTQITQSDAQEIAPDWGDNNTLYFLSAENGRYNVHQQKITGNGQLDGPTVALTNFSDVGIRNFDVAANGQKMIFERGIDIYTQSTVQRSGQPKKLDIQLTLDDKFYKTEHQNFSNRATEYALSPNEKLLAFSVRGEIFVKENNKDKKRSVRITNHAYRDQSPAWLNDSTLIFISDRSGNNDLYLARSSDPYESNLFKTFKREIKPIRQTMVEEEAFYLSPDRTQIAFRAGRGMFKVASIDSNGVLANEKILLDGWDIVEGVSWSPDSKWLAYALEDLDFNEEIYIHPVDNRHPGINVSFHPRSDSDPVWSQDGSKLGFRSIRNNGDADVWFVWLKKEDWEKTQIDWEEDTDEPTEKNGKDDKKDKKKKEVEPIKIDFDDIHKRLVQVTHLPGNEDNLQVSKDGEWFYFTTNGGGRTGGGGDQNLMKIKWNGEDMKTMVPKASVRQLQVDKAGKNLHMMKSGGSMAKLKIDGGKLENLPFQAKMEIDYAAERQQIFDEGWRSINDGFYDPEFHGNDWKKLRDYYEPIALSASTSQDFRDIFNEMLGQLNASHMGMSGSNPEDTKDDVTGLLGIEVKPSKSGVEVTKIVPNTPADKTGSKLMIGDEITHVNLEPVSKTDNFFGMLNQVVNEKILLSINRNGAQEEIVIRPTRSIRGALYEEWVEERRRLTDEYSGGRLGYIHIQGMNWPSFERFERELAASGQGKEGIVVDVRFNGGGWTTDMLMAVLNVQQHSYTVPRGAANSLEAEHKNFKAHYPFGERLPLSSWTKPSIALCNQNSYSNAEIFSHAYKTLGIGTLVGTPTFGAVISTGSQSLIDGSRVRMPFRGWYVKATEENMEHGPAVPDVIIDNEPDSKAKGEDLQLKKAVELLLIDLGKT